MRNISARKLVVALSQAALFLGLAAWTATRGIWVAAAVLGVFGVGRILLLLVLGLHVGGGRGRM